MPGTMRILMRADKRSEDGLSVYAAGSTNTVSVEFGARLVQEGSATDLDGALQRVPDSLSIQQVAALQQGKILAADGGLLANSEATPYVTMTATGTAFSGPCELAGWYCSVAAGTITIYDGTSVTGTPIVPATALVVGPMPIFGAGTNGRLQLTAGCHVVLSGAATVRVAVGA